jgi:hypothetical protein
MRPTRRTVAVLLVLLAGSLLAGPRVDVTARASLTAVVSQLGHAGSSDATVEAHRSLVRSPALLPLAWATRPDTVDLPSSAGGLRLVAPASDADGTSPAGEPARGPPGS